MIYEFAKPKDLEAVAALLNTCKLPANDLEAHEFIVAVDENMIVGCIGMELEGPLLRSLAVDPANRKQGIAGELCARLLRHAGDQDVKNLYLLTDSADKFFERIGFQRINREDAPESVRTHKQFTELCPSSAIVMRKEIGR